MTISFTSSVNNNIVLFHSVEQVLYGVGISFHYYNLFLLLLLLLLSTEITVTVWNACNYEILLNFEISLKNGAD